MLGRLLRRRGSLGARGERIAAGHLEKKGYRVLARNVRAPMGEIDLVCESPDGRTIVVVEVKTRQGGGDRPAAEASVTGAKRAKLVKLTGWLRRTNGWEGRAVRIDVVGVEVDGRGRRVTHFESAVDARGRA